MKKVTSFIILALVSLFTVVACVPANAKQTFNTSYYGPGFNRHLTASGERYNQDGLSAAHKKLPFGTMVKITNLKNNKSVNVKVNDRGPFVKGRNFDLSVGANKVINCNLCNTKYEVLKLGDGKYRKNQPVKQLEYPPIRDNIQQIKYKQTKPKTLRLFT